MNEMKNIQEAEIRRLNAERDKLELESQEIKLRLNNKWWQGTSLLKYIVSTFIAIGLILAWVQSFLNPLISHQKEINLMKSERDKIQNELLTAQKDDLTEKQAKLEKQNSLLTERREELVRQNDILQKDQIKLIKETHELANRQKTLKTVITILKTVLNKDGRDYFSILNHGDPINVLRDYGWNLPSTDFITWLGYYIRATNKDVWQGKEILIAREFEIDDLKTNYPDHWKEKLKKETDHTPILALDYTYVGLQVDKNLAVGGTLYMKDGKGVDFYFPLRQWAKELDSILTSE